MRCQQTRLPLRPPIGVPPPADFEADQSILTSKSSPWSGETEKLRVLTLVSAGGERRSARPVLPGTVLTPRRHGKCTVPRKKRQGHRPEVGSPRRSRGPGAGARRWPHSSALLEGFRFDPADASQRNRQTVSDAHVTRV